MFTGTKLTKLSTGYLVKMGDLNCTFVRVHRSVDSSFWRDEIQILQKLRILNDIFVRR
jgi:hypothetical protein